ncbi:MAG TPA: hypothetical protein VHR72_14340 [Gemmataceae bacterium]|nr:hypothetical protein [Gemmataceae bacterium]
MKPGDIILISLAQFGGGPPKLRPALFLADLPGPYQDVLACGISTKLTPLRPDWDEVIRRIDSDFSSSGLHHDSAIRLSYLGSAGAMEVAGVIGSIDPARLSRFRHRLSDHLRP